MASVDQYAEHGLETETYTHGQNGNHHQHSIEGNI